jgi:hypothetical protein
MKTETIMKVEAVIEAVIITETERVPEIKTIP